MRLPTDTKHVFLSDFQAIIMIIAIITIISVIIQRKYVKLSTGFLGLGQGPMPSSFQQHDNIFVLSVTVRSGEFPE
jgi:hypothetical protein